MVLSGAGLLVPLIVGAIAGWLAGAIVKGRRGGVPEVMVLVEEAESPLGVGDRAREVTRRKGQAGTVDRHSGRQPGEVLALPVLVDRCLEPPLRGS